MTLVVEDGTGVAGANSYISVADAATYHATRNNTAWADAASSPDTEREGALIRATTWIDATYRSRWPGTKLGGRTQALEWPREDAEDANGDDIGEDEIPQELLNALCEAALRELDSPGSLLPDYNPAQRVLREKLADLEVQYSEGGSTAAIPVFPLIEAILGGLLGGSTPQSYFGFASRGG